MGMGWRGLLETVGVGALALAVGVVAFVHEGVPAAEVELNDGGVWVSNGAQMLVGHLNFESRTLDGGLRADSSGFDLSQFGGDVLVTQQDRRVQVVDTASVALVSEVLVEGLDFAHGGGTVLFADAVAGKVWSSGIESIGGFTPQADPLVEGLDLPRVVVGVEGDAFVVTADGVVWGVRGVGGDASVVEVGSLGAGLSEGALLTVVGDVLVVLDQGVVRTVDRVVEVEGLGVGAVLQQPSLGDSEVLVASGDGLWRVPLGGGEAVVSEVPLGVPVRPVALDGCVYGLWEGSGYYLRECVGGVGDEGLVVPGLVGALDPVFRVNRHAIVINDVASGAVWLPLVGMERVDDWDLVANVMEGEEEDSEDSGETVLSDLVSFSEERNAPVARDDLLGVRAGRATTLPVLVNDVDVDGDVLTVVVTSQPEGVVVGLGKDGRVVRVDVPAEVSGDFSFTYQAFDGELLSNEARVTVEVIGEGVNRAPEKVRSQTLRVGERASAEYSVLPDWVDADGDPVFLEDVVGDDGLRVTWRPDGFISVRDLGGVGPGRRSVTVLVSDGVDSTPGELAVQVMPGAANTPPVANNDHFVASVGEAVVLRPLSNDTDADGDGLRLVELGATAPGVDVTPDYLENTVRFVMSEAGTQTIVYAISDGSDVSRGRIRVDVVDPSGVSESPVAGDDLALLGASGVVVLEPLVNDFDPAGGVLVVQSVSMGSARGVTVEVVNHALLRISAPAGMTQPQRFEYSVSNGVASASAAVLVVPLAVPAEDQPPVAVADTAVVRAGDIVSVDVLVNDYSPMDLPIRLRAFGEPPSTDLGEFFVSGDRVRFRAGELSGTAEAVYTIEDSQGLVASIPVTVSVKGAGDGNQPPVPGPVTARTIAGKEVLIPIPMDGIDPDGDSVELIGTGSVGPRLGSVTAEGNYLHYRPSVSGAGTDVFSYRVQDRFGETADGVVRVGIAAKPTLNQAPVAVPDEIATRPGISVEIPVTDNDIDPDGDEIALVSGSVEPVDPSWVPEFTGEGQKIVLVAPSLAGVYQLYYGIVDKPAGQANGGVPVVGVVTVTVDEDVAPVAPVARDDYVPVASIAGLDMVEVAVLINDNDPDGDTKSLTVTVDQPATVSGSVVAVPVRDDRQVLLYTITDADGLDARAAIIVPGRRQVPPMLNPGVDLPARVKAGETLLIDMADYVLVRDGHTAKLNTLDSLKSGPGGNTQDPDLGLRPVGETAVSFTPDPAFHGATSVTFEVTDGDTIDDPRGLRATVSVPIMVEAAGVPPELRPSEVKLAPGEPPRVVSLAGMVNDPNPGDNQAMVYALVRGSSGLEASVAGQSLTLSVPAETRQGSKGEVVVSVDDGDTIQEMTIPVTVIASTRPLMSVTDVTDPEGRAGTTRSFDLTSLVTNPFADQGQPIRLVGHPSVTTGAADVDVNALTINITPHTSSGTRDDTTDVVVSYTVADATGDTTRQRTGTIRMIIKDTPLPPANVTAEAIGSKTARVTWTPSRKLPPEPLQTNPHPLPPKTKPPPE